jgi:putative hydroxymethylpyrimidine transporter CytX
MPAWETQMAAASTRVEVGSAAITEVPPTLVEPTPKALGLLDQLGLWTNMGFTLLGFTGAIYVLDPLGDQPLSLLAALVAVGVGTLVGTLAIAAAAAAGSITGAPSMVLLRGLVGGRLSYAPTVLNVLQCIGWGTFEIATISNAAHQIAGDVATWVWVLLAGAITTAMTIRPLGAIRVIRRYVTVLVLIVMVYLLVQLLRHPLPPLTHGTWSGFWIAVDVTIAVAVSFVPLAADYTRHARSTRSAVAGAMGFGLGQAACYTIGLIALLTVAKSPDEIAGAFIAVPVGTLCFAVLATRELDLAFADVYSTAISVQNVRPRWDRRILGVAIGTGTTALALWLGIDRYPDFLYLLGSVFVPLTAVLLVDFYVVSSRQWDLSQTAPTRWRNLIPWALGFCTYQLINPGTLSGWHSMWTSIADGIGFTPQTWMSASLCALVVSAAATALVAIPGTLREPA